jgi:hypothetical protein
MPNIGGIIRKWTVTFSGLNFQSKDNESFFKMLSVASRNATYPQKGKSSVYRCSILGAWQEVITDFVFYI